MKEESQLRKDVTLDARLGVLAGVPVGIVNGVLAAWRISAEYQSLPLIVKISSGVLVGAVLGAVIGSLLGGGFGFVSRKIPMSSFASKTVIYVVVVWVLIYWGNVALFGASSSNLAWYALTNLVSVHLLWAIFFIYFNKESSKWERLFDRLWFRSAARVK